MEDKTAVRRIFLFTLAAGAVCFLALGLFWRIFYTGQFQTVTFMWERPSVSSAQVQKLILSAGEEAPGAKVAGWNRRSETVFCEEGFRSAKMEVFSVSGEMELVFPGEYLEGMPLTYSDPGMCVITSAAAEKLLGTSHVQGIELRIGEEEYCIKGVADLKTPVVFCSAGEEEQFTAVAISMEGDRNTAQKAEELLTLQGISAADCVSDGCLMLLWAKLLSMFPLWVLCFAGIAVLFRKAFRLRGSALLFSAGLFGALILLFLLFFWIGLSIELPDRFIPSKWSDFDFYGSLIEGLSENFYTLRQFRPGIKQLLLREVLIKITAYSALSLIFSCVFLIVLRRNASRHES